MKKVSLWKRIRYWLDRRMAKGTISMVKLLLLVVLFMATLVPLATTTYVPAQLSGAEVSLVYSPLPPPLPRSQPRLIFPNSAIDTPPALRYLPRPIVFKVIWSDRSRNTEVERWMRMQ